MNEQQEFLSLVIQKLEAYEIPYMITGSAVSGAYGEPRATMDIDILINPAEPQLMAFMKSFDERFYADELMARDAFRAGSMFNIIDTHTGWKIDLILSRGTEYDNASFRRRRKIMVLQNVSAFAVAPEDIILRKLVWSRKGDSSRQLRDAYGVAATITEIDHDYMKKWAAVLNVSDLLEDILRDKKEME